MARQSVIMSNINEARAVRYLLDAIIDRSIIDSAINDGLYSIAIFHAQQVCEKSTKACLSLLGVVVADEHLYINFLKNMVIPNSKALRSDFLNLMSDLNKLESAYITSRYGVGRSGDIHYKKYDKNDVISLSRSSSNFLETCFLFTENRTGKKLPREITLLDKYFLENYKDHIREIQ